MRIKDCFRSKAPGKAGATKDDGSRIRPRKAKQFVASLCASAILAVAVVSPAAAQNQDQDGLVNVAIGNIVVEDVNVGVAAIGGHHLRREGRAGGGSRPGS